MAWADTPYATPTEYKTRNARSSSGDDTTLAAMLLSVSRVVDRRLGVAPAEFAPHSSVTFTCRANGSGPLLYLRDEQGRQHFLRTVTADSLLVDSEGDGTFDGYTLDLTDTWVRGYPINAATYNEPFTALELRAGVAGAAPSSWADGVEVRVTGNWGWAAVPGAIKERVIAITRELVEAHSEGGSFVIQDIDAAVQMNSAARSLLVMLEREYNYRLPVVA